MRLNMNSSQNATLNPDLYETTPSSYRGKLAFYAKEYGWVLCVGAGTSKGIFPDWNELAKELVKQTTLACCDAQIDTFLRDFGPQALIQVMRNNHRSGPRKKPLPEKALDTWMIKQLSKTMFKRLRNRTSSKWATIAKGLTLVKPFGLNKNEWSSFKEQICGIGGTSAPAIAGEIARVVSTPKAPKAIISFNAEPLLFALINCYCGLKKPKMLDDNNAQ